MVGKKHYQDGEGGFKSFDGWKISISKKMCIFHRKNHVMYAMTFELNRLSKQNPNRLNSAGLPTA